jgi:hypothetical protein
MSCYLSGPSEWHFTIIWRVPIIKLSVVCIFYSYCYLNCHTTWKTKSGPLLQLRLKRSHFSSLLQGHKSLLQTACWSTHNNVSQLPLPHVSSQRKSTPTWMTGPELFDMQTGRAEYNRKLETGRTESSVRFETESWRQRESEIGNNSHQETNRIILQRWRCPQSTNSI